MRRNAYILIALVLVLVLVGIYFQRLENTEKSANYQIVAIKELISDIAKYDGQKILIKGKFTDRRDKPILDRMCTGSRAEKKPEIREEYRAYSSTWGIYDQDEIIAVIVIDKSGRHISTMPNYKEGQEIKLKGIVRSATVGDYCNKNIRYRSVYIEVNPKDIDITLKPLPSVPPESK